MKTSEPILFDTNVLVYNQDQDSKFYAQAAMYHDKALSGKITAMVSSQNLLELVAVITNQERITRPLTQKQVSLEVEKYLSSSSFTVIYPNDQTMTFFTKLLKRYRLKISRQTFDLFLVATMLSNNIRKILTANIQDFRSFKEIEILKFH